MIDCLFGIIKILGIIFLMHNKYQIKLNTQQRVQRHTNYRTKCNIEKGCFILCLFFLLQHKYFSCKKISQTWQLGQQVSRLSPVSNMSPSSMLNRLLRKKTYHQRNENKKWSEHLEQWCSWEIKQNQVFIFKVKSIMRHKFISVYLPYTGTHYVAYSLCFN